MCASAEHSWLSNVVWQHALGLQWILWIDRTVVLVRILATTWLWDLGMELSLVLCLWFSSFLLLSPFEL